MPSVDIIVCSMGDSIEVLSSDCGEPFDGREALAGGLSLMVDVVLASSLSWLWSMVQGAMNGGWVVLVLSDLHTKFW